MNVIAEYYWNVSFNVRFPNIICKLGKVKQTDLLHFPLNYFQKGEKQIYLLIFAKSFSINAFSAALICCPLFFLASLKVLMHWFINCLSQALFLGQDSERVSRQVIE